jgi:hypothetical protein
MKNLLCKLAHWILDNFEPIDVFNAKIRLNGGTYKVVEVTQNHDFSEVTIKAEQETISFSA